VDGQLVELLAVARQGKDPTEEILDLLARVSSTHDWAAEALADPAHRPPELTAPVERALDGGYSTLPNPAGSDAVDADKYVCPVDGNFAWWRIWVADTVPTCPDHPGSALVPA
jgi:hypothetical protein